MSVELASEIWSELKRFVNTVDRDDAAETMVAVLIDNDIAADEIRNAFKGDSDVKRALTSYLRDHDHEDDIEDDEDVDEDEDDDYKDY